MDDENLRVFVSGGVPSTIPLPQKALSDNFQVYVANDNPGSVKVLDIDRLVIELRPGDTARFEHGKFTPYGRREHMEEKWLAFGHYAEGPVKP